MQAYLSLLREVLEHGESGELTRENLPDILVVRLSYFRYFL